MRFLYGVILGVLASVISSILYLALAGGEYLLILSPRYQELRSRVVALERAEEQRDQLADRLQELERRFTDLSQRFTEMRGGTNGASESHGTDSLTTQEAPAATPSPAPAEDPPPAP